ncbi:hypothetical protein [Edaphobacter sp. DSM 109919]|uniref:Uncharacterized protein n=1 Tax=Edaphobacter paludis TaxID=3035702 RepID=A0AAU7CUM8_9BACT
MPEPRKDQYLRALLFAVLSMALASSAHSQDLVHVDGVTPECVHNQRYQVQHPGPGTLFPTPQYGYCKGTIQNKCATSTNVAVSGTFYQEIPNACVGTFTSWADLQAQQATSISDLKQQLQEQLNILKADIKRLSDANDALTKRLNDAEARLKKLEQPK